MFCRGVDMLQNLISWLQRLRWSVRTKIGAAFALVLLCFIVNGIVSVLLLFNIKESDAQRKNNAVDLERLQRYELAYENEVRIYSAPDGRGS